MNAIEVNNLCVTYYCMNQRSLRKILFGKDKKEEEKTEAVKDVSFSVPKGEILGIIGKNGSGKSTLLKTIGGVFSPDSGSVDLKGNSVMLQAIGVGFKNDLSGKENVYISGMLMGMGRKEIEEKLPLITEFSELGYYMEKPVKTYSSGMRSKLAFSITAILETDIMLIDEVLSVGDEHFKKKSMDKMKQLMFDEERTVLIVSHSIPTLKELCSRVIWFDSGQIKMDGEPGKVLSEYKISQSK